MPEHDEPAHNFRGLISLAISGSAEFTTPNHQGILKKAPLLQIDYQSSTTLIQIFTLVLMLHRPHPPYLKELIQSFGVGR